MRLRLPGLLFLSGASSLAYELVWTRLLGGVFGVALHATTAVLVAYMAGLSLGGFVGGRLARRLRSPLRVYAVLEAAIGISALLVPLGLGALGQLQGWLYEPLLARPGLGFALRFVGALAVLIVPTTLMGATLPIAAQGSIESNTHLGAEAGRLYAANTTGAVAGAAATGLWLLPGLGVSRTNQVSAALSVAVALLAFAMVGQAAPARAPAIEEHREAGGAPARAILILAGLSGFVSLSYEIVWTHVLAAATRDTTFAFTCTLCAFLAGIALGGWIGAWASARARAALGLAVCQAGAAMAGLLSFAVMRWLGAAEPDSAVASFRVAMVEQLARAAALMLLPASLLGASLPLCLHLAGRARAGRASSGSGRAVGSVLAANTLGAVLGCVFTGLGLIQSLGFGKVTALLSAMSLGGALLALGVDRAKGRSLRKLQKWRLLALGAIVLDVVVVLPAASTNWFFPGRSVEGRVVFHAEDASGIVEVTEKDGVRTLITDRRHRWGSTQPAVIQSMLRQGTLPLLLHPRPAHIVEIGLASGIHSLPQIRDERVERLTIVEISPAIIEAARVFAAHNGDLLANPRVEVVQDDGRSFLERTRRRFDVVILGLFVPYRPGAGALYSRELLSACRERLEPGGLLLEWLPLDQMSFEAVRSVMATFLSVFPHVEAWEKAHYLVLVGADAPEPLDLGQMLRGALLQARRQHREAYAAFAEALRTDPDDEIARGEVARYNEAMRRMGPGRQDP